MNKLLPLLLILLSFSAFGQTSQPATPTYAENGQLIGLTNLSGLEECSSANLLGKLKEIKTEEPFAVFELKSKKERQSVRVDLERLSARDRSTFFQHLMKKGRPLRVSGYRCGNDDFIRAISIDRSY